MKKKSHISKKQRIRGFIFIGMGIIGLINYIVTAFKDIQLGTIGFLIVLVSIGLIWDGWRAIKGKKSLLFSV